MEILENTVYFTNRCQAISKFRRVISVFGNYVYYSTGSDSNSACQVKTFERWIFDDNVSMGLTS